MLRHMDCERYREWKKEQDAQLKGTKRKIKTKKQRKDITDCLEEEKKEKPKTILKIHYRKCAQKETKKPKQGMIFKLRPVSSAELLLKRIQPPLEIRNPLLARRHAECFTDIVPQFDATLLRETAVPKPRRKIPKAGRKRKRSKRRKKDEVETTASEDEKVKTEEEEQVAEEEKAAEEQEEEETVNEEEGTEQENVEEAEETVEEKENVEEEGDAGAIDENDDKREVKPRRKDKFWCKKFKRKIVPESEESECESICSFDSDICLKGLALTAEDKKKIQENRRNVQASSAA